MAEEKKTNVFDKILDREKVKEKVKNKVKTIQTGELKQSVDKSVDRWLDVLEGVGNGKTYRQAMLDAGYSERKANHPKRVLDSKGFKILIDEIFPEEAVKTMWYEWLNHQETIVIKNENGIEVKPTGQKSKIAWEAFKKMLDIRERAMLNDQKIQSYEKVEGAKIQLNLLELNQRAEEVGKRFLESETPKAEIENEIKITSAPNFEDLENN